MIITRKQLSLYVPPDAAAVIEAIRTIVDPLQQQLIPAHVTLCREDELSELAQIKARLQALPCSPLTLQFGQLESFAGHGWLLNCIAGEETFQQLREAVLGAKAIRTHTPHLTLAHPRNQRATGNVPAAFANLPPAITITFPAIYLIEQVNHEPWQILERYALPKPEHTTVEFNNC